MITMTKKGFPADIKKEIALKETKPVEKIITLTYIKQTKQYSIKIPSKIAMIMNLKPKNKIKIRIEEEKIILEKVK